MSKRKIVVCGATGNKGGAVVRSLLNSPEWHVVALTRDPSSSAALVLKNLGAEVAEADTRDYASIITAFQNAYGVFGISQPWSADKGCYDIQSEIIQGKNIIWGCKSAGVEHTVFSSFINLYNNRTGVSFIDSKLVLERHVREHLSSFTILRPALHMENLELKLSSDGNNNIYGSFPADAKIPYVALADVGGSVAAIFKDPAKYSSATIDLIGDFVTGNGIADKLIKILGRDSISFVAASPVLLRLFNRDRYRLRRYFEQFAYAPYPPEIIRAIEVSKRNFNTPTNMDMFLQNWKSISKL
jgi:uncharacterized protein YbjT (DUF2867 family)